MSNRKEIIGFLIGLSIIGVCTIISLNWWTSDFDEANERLNFNAKTYSLDQQSADSVYYYLESDQSLKALSTLNRMHERNPKDLSVRLMMTRILIQFCAKDQIDYCASARWHLEQIEELDPNHPELEELKQLYKKAVNGK